MSVYRQLGKSISAGPMWSKFWAALFACLFCFSLEATTFPGSITLINDSPYILTASVYTQSGDFLGQVTLQPGEQKNFTTNLSMTQLNRPGFPDTSTTPFRIIWTCAGGENFAMAQDGAVGSTVRASLCPGQQFCTPKKEEPKQAPPPKSKK